MFDRIASCLPTNHPKASPGTYRKRVCGQISSCTGKRDNEPWRLGIVEPHVPELSSHKNGDKCERLKGLGPVNL